MKRMIAIIVMIVMIGCSVLAEAGRTDDAVVFLNAIDMLKQTKSRQSVAEAQEMLEGINSNYNQANMFGMYASAIVDIYDDNFNEAQNKLTVLQMNSDFSGLLKQYGLPELSVLENYIVARQAETEGRYSEAFELYTSMNFLDSLDRSVNLVGASKEQQYVAAEELYEEGLYAEAAEAFTSLGNYKDSASRAEDCLARVTPEPTPSPTPSPSPMPAPTPAPTPIPTIIENQDLFSSINVSTSTINDPEYPSLGMNTHDEPVNYWLVLELTSCLKAVSGWKVTWTDTIDESKYAMGKVGTFAQSWLDTWNLAKAGKTVHDSYGAPDLNQLSGAIIYLPDDSTIEGNQTISLFFDDSIRVDVYIDLAYLGDYTTGTGWEATLLGFDVWAI